MAVATADPQVSLRNLRATGRDLVSLVGGVGADRLRREPAGGGWSPTVVLAHLADAELVYGFRIRMVVAGARPFLASYDEEAWARRFASLDLDPKESLARWRILRDSNLGLLDSLDDDEWKLSGLHPDLGEITVARMAARMANHDREHLDQIRHGLATR
jgi:hypothetical protein